MLLGPDVRDVRNGYCSRKRNHSPAELATATASPTLQKSTRNDHRESHRREVRMPARHARHVREEAVWQERDDHPYGCNRYDGCPTPSTANKEDRDCEN